MPDVAPPATPKNLQQVVEHTTAGLLNLIEGDSENKLLINNNISFSDMQTLLTTALSDESFMSQVLRPKFQMPMAGMMGGMPNMAMMQSNLVVAPKA